MNSNSNSTQPDDSEVSAYLANRLNENQAQAFEQYCLDHPNFARDVEQELQLKVGLQQLNQPPKVAATRRSPRTWWPVALAASIAIAALVFFEFRPAPAPALTAFRSLTDLPTALQRAPVTSIGLMQMRGSDEVTSVTAPIDGIIELRFLADPAMKTDDYSVEATPVPGAGSANLKIDGLRAKPDGYIRLYVPAKQMNGKIWVVTFVAASNPNSKQSFRVQFKPAGTPSAG